MMFKVKQREMVEVEPDYINERIVWRVVDKNTMEYLLNSSAGSGLDWMWDR